MDEVFYGRDSIASWSTMVSCYPFFSSSISSNKCYLGPMEVRESWLNCFTGLRLFKNGETACTLVEVDCLGFGRMDLMNSYDLSAGLIPVDISVFLNFT